MLRIPLLPLAFSLAVVSSLQAADVPGPAGYLKIMADSKLQYRIVAEPAKTPAEELTCARRTLKSRVVRTGTGLELVDWSVKPEAQALLDEGEVFYSRKDYAAAGEKYAQAIGKDPEAVSAYFLYGDALLFGGNATAGLEQYQKGIALDPTMPLGYFFTSTAYVHLGRKAEAREAVIQALTRHPAYDSIWTVATKSPAVWGIRPVDRHPFQPPAGYLGKRDKDGVDIFSGAKGEWLGYAVCKAVWANEKQFEKRHGGANGWSLDEERACVLNQVQGAYNTAGATKAAVPPLERHLLDMANAGLLDGYILFEIIGQRCPLAISMLLPEQLHDVEAYVRKYLVVAE